MKKDILARWIIGSIGLVLFVGTVLFGDSPHWPTFLSVQRAVTSGSVYGLVLLGVVYVMWSAAAGLRDYTGRIFGPTGWFHWNPSIVPGTVGGRLAIPLGGVQARKFFISTEGSDGTLLAPPDACILEGENLRVTGVWESVEPHELDPAERRALARQGRREPYYQVLYPAVVEHRGVARQRVHANALAAASVNHVEDRMKDVIRASNQSMQHVLRVNERLTGRRPLGILQRAFGAKDEQAAPPVSASERT